MRIAVVGAGGVGGYFGAKLALAGNDVTFIARGPHLAALRERGLRVETGGATLLVDRVRATDDPAGIGPVDVAMSCVKLWDVDSTASALAPLLAEGGVVIPFQNGVDAPEILRRSLGNDRVLGGVAYIAATIASPGVIAHTGTMARLRVGAFEPALQPRAVAFVAAGRAAGFECDLAPDIRRALWEKFVFLSALAGCTTLARQPVGAVRGDPDLRATFRAAMQEAFEVSRARGVGLASDFVAQQMKMLDSLPAQMRSSMQNDLAAGNRLEAPWLCGAVARMGRESGVSTPVSATIHAALKPYIDGKPH
jgi:2-dehydropantoate 2-reductase